MTALTQKRTNHSFSPGNQGPVPQKFMRHGRLFLVLLLNVLLLTVNLGALDPNTPIDKYIHHTWTTRDGLPQNTIHSIVQDGYGYLWLGTDRGAVRFDGTNFRTFTNINVAEIKNNSITSLFIAGDGTVWIGTYGGGVTRYREKNFKNHSTQSFYKRHRRGLSPKHLVWYHR
jgi:ligand-binding sensor domain-containing protein